MRSSGDDLLIVLFTGGTADGGDVRSGAPLGCALEGDELLVEALEGCWMEVCVNPVQCGVLSTSTGSWVGAGQESSLKPLEVNHMEPAMSSIICWFPPSL
ncbi:hypothetical protein DNTS_022112 [Danionella cerebrum]|uniref:Uncharacterized protein n=1 Tax=Danionella cerebrum TaxID=2873325 RepID=A0A553R0K1_9TELE|nr:hypothetical protein DNTS_022112 [Danionella translucida]TRY95706.1 hypothetical protein DNTS_022112 [Danionella translucida]